MIQSGELETVEWSNYALALRFTAAAMGVPFVVARSMLGTDTLARSAAKVIDVVMSDDEVVDLGDPRELRGGRDPTGITGAGVAGVDQKRFAGWR